MHDRLGPHLLTRTLAPNFRSTVLDEGPHVVSSVLARAYASRIIERPPTDATLRLFVGSLLSYVLSHGLLTPPDAVREPATEELSKFVDLFLAAVTQVRSPDEESLQLEQ